MADADADPPFKRECRNSTVEKMATMRTLSEAMGGKGVIQLGSLVPISKIIESIVTMDKPAFKLSLAELRECTAKRKNEISLQNLASIAEINFFEGFDSFISFIYKGGSESPKREVEEEDNKTAVSSRGASPSKAVAPKRRSGFTVAPRPEKCRRLSTKKQVSGGDREEKEEEEEEGDYSVADETASSSSRRKSTRRPMYDTSRFECLFTRCKEEFGTVKELGEHAKSCIHKKDRLLVFRCSHCKRCFRTDKAVKAHIAHWAHIACSHATIQIENVNEAEFVAEEGKTKNHQSNIVIEGKKKEEEEEKEEKEREEKKGEKGGKIKCTVEGCKSESASANTMYVHVKKCHKDRNTSFECGTCGEKRTSGQSIEQHRDRKCPGARILLRLLKKSEMETEHISSTPSTPAAPPPRSLLPPLSSSSSSHQRPSRGRDKWENDLQKCPLEACGFISISAKFVLAHFKKFHKEHTLAYSCSKCHYGDESVEKIIEHCKKCPRSIVRAVVDGMEVEETGNTTDDFVPPRSKSMGSASGMELRKRGGKDREKKSISKEVSGADIDMPVLEMIDTEEEEEEVEKRENEEEEEEEEDEKEEEEKEEGEEKEKEVDEAMEGIEDEDELDVVQVEKENKEEEKKEEERKEEEEKEEKKEKKEKEEVISIVSDESDMDSVIVEEESGFFQEERRKRAMKEKSG